MDGTAIKAINARQSFFMVISLIQQMGQKKALRYRSALDETDF
jgi:hypothetical protein